MAAAAFVPPQYSDIGKKASDLFKKKYDPKKDFKTVVQTKNKTQQGLVFTTGGEWDSSNNLSASLKTSYKKDTFGEVLGEVSTQGPAKAELKLKKLGVKGLGVTVVADTAAAYNAGKKFDSTTGKITAEYAQDFFAGSAAWETNFFKRNILTGSAVVGFEGLSVGGEVAFDTTAIKDVDDYNVGAQYQGADFTASAKTSEQGKLLTGQYIHTVNSDVSVGGKIDWKIDGTNTLGGGLATEWKVDANTTVKLRGDTSKKLGAHVEHRLANPRLQLGLAAQWAFAGFSLPKPAEYGLTATFGDFDADK
jgi:hypothetical protein